MFKKCQCDRAHFSGIQRHQWSNLHKHNQSPQLAVAVWADIRSLSPILVSPNSSICKRKEEDFVLIFSWKCMRQGLEIDENPEVFFLLCCSSWLPLPSECQWENTIWTRSGGGKLLTKHYIFLILCNMPCRPKKLLPTSSHPFQAEPGLWAQPLALGRQHSMVGCVGLLFRHSQRQTFSSLFITALKCALQQS